MQRDSHEHQGADNPIAKLNLDRMRQKMFQKGIQNFEIRRRKIKEPAIKPSSNQQVNDIAPISIFKIRTNRE